MTQIKNIMQKKVVTVTEDEGIQKLCKILTQKKLTGLPVVNKKKTLVGFVSERDIIAAFGKQTCLDMTIKKIMTRKVKTVDPDDPLVAASKIFQQFQIRILPVAKNGKVVGVIARKDMIEHMLGDYNL